MKPIGNALAICSLLLSSAFASAPPDAPTNLRVNDVAAPVGTDSAVYMGWQVNDPDANELQSAYQILVASSEAKLAADEGDVWDSGQTRERLQNHVAFAGKSLMGDTRYFWKVRTWDKDGKVGPYSAPNTFAVGLLRNEDWSGAHWIRRDSDDPDDYTYYRKKVALPDKSIERATAYVSGTHKFALHVNGTLAGKGPAYHHPEYQYYNGFDITSLLETGKQNQFAIFNHWFGGGQGRPASARGVIMKAIIHYSDGSQEEFGTDGSWLQTKATAWIDGQPQRNAGEGVGYVEKIDANLLTPDWHTLSFDDSTWKPVTVIGPHPSAPWTGPLAPDLTRIEEIIIKPASITDKGNGTYLVDLGKVYSGMPRIHFSGGKKGNVIEMQGGYGLTPSGEIDKNQNQKTNLDYRAVLNGDSFTYEPTEYLGFRYFQINNAPMPVTGSNFEFIARHSEMDHDASSFESSDPTLNAVWDLMKHSIFTCAQEEFVDTPTREKGGFLGDAAIQSTVAMPVLNERVLTQRVLREFLQSMDQHWSGPADRGRMNAVYPNNDGGRDIPDFTQAYLPWVWNYYMETGDRTFLSTYYSKFKDIADYVKRHENPETGLVTDLTGGSNAYIHGIIDWPASMRYGYDISTAARTVINGWAYSDYETLAMIADVLGKTSDRDTYLAHADELKKAINTHLLSDKGVYIDGLSSEGEPSPHVSQHANMFPLALGIVPSDQRPSVIASIKEQRMKVGMVTVTWLVDALGQADQGPHLIELFTNPEWDGWARALARGATATWECWDADTADQSQSHAWGAAGLKGYVRFILGIRPLKPQYEEVLIQPLDFGEKLGWAKGSITSDRGQISTSWKSEAGSYRLIVDLPANVTAKVALPRGPAADAVVHLDGSPVAGTVDGNFIVVSGVGSGKHTFVRYDHPPR